LLNELRQTLILQVYLFSEVNFQTFVGDEDVAVEVDEISNKHLLSYSENTEGKHLREFFPSVEKSIFLRNVFFMESYM
jgi:hypothetical protein